MQEFVLQITNLKEKNYQLSDEIEELKNEVQNVQEKADNQLNQGASSLSDINQKILQDKIDLLSNQNNKMTGQLTHLQKENNDYIRTKIKNEEEIQKLKEKVKWLSVEKVEAEEQLVLVQKEFIEIKKLNEEKENIINSQKNTLADQNIKITDSQKINNDSQRQILEQNNQAQVIIETNNSFLLQQDFQVIKELRQETIKVREELKKTKLKCQRFQKPAGENEMSVEETVSLENEKLIGINTELEKQVKELQKDMIKKDEQLREYLKYNKIIEDFNQVNNSKESWKDNQLFVITLKGVLKFVEFVQRIAGYLQEFADSKTEISGKRLFELLEKSGTFETNLMNALEEFEESVTQQMLRVREEWAEWRSRVRELENLVEKTSDSLIEKELRSQVDCIEKELLTLKWAQVEWKTVNSQYKFLFTNRQDVVNQYFVQVNMQNRIMKQMYELIRQMKNDLFQVRQANLNLKQDNINLAETLALLLKKQSVLFSQWQESQKQREQLEQVSDTQLKLTQDVLYQKVQQLLQELDNQKQILAQEYEVKLRDGLQFLMVKNSSLEKLLDGAEQDMLSLQTEKGTLEENCYDLKNTIKQFELDKQFLTEQVNSLVESKQVLLDEHENKVIELQNNIQNETEKFDQLQDQFKGIDIDNLNYTLNKIQNQRESLKGIVNKLEIAQGSMRANLSCLLCLKQMIEPRTLAPCGHTFCLECVEKFKATKTCPECDGEPFSYIFRNKQMNEVLCKMVYIQQMIEALDVPDCKFEPIQINQSKKQLQQQQQQQEEEEEQEQQQ